MFGGTRNPNFTFENPYRWYSYEYYSINHIVKECKAVTNMNNVGITTSKGYGKSIEGELVQ